MLKVDGGKPAIQRKPETAEKPKTKPATTNLTARPETNSAVHAKNFQTTIQAGLVRLRLTAQVNKNAPAPTQADSAQSTPTITPQEAQQRADEIIADNGGRNNLNTDGVGQDLAEIARQNPDDAWAITQAMLGDQIDQDGRGKVKENDKDEIAQSFTRSLSDTELQTIAQSSDGKKMLERFQQHLLAGSAHEDERADALRLETAVNGYPPPQLSGNPEEDIQTINNDLNNIPPDKRDDYLLEVMQSDAGIAALQYAGNLDDAGSDRLADALNDAYNQNPSAVSEALNKTLDSPIAAPPYVETGLADVLARTGNDQMIAGYAKHAMDIANNSTDTFYDSSSLKALTALGGMSPEGLQNFINFGSANPPQYGSPSTMGRFIEQNNENFFKMLNGAMDNFQPWVAGPAIDDLLNVASQMTDANGQLSPNAIRIFSSAVEHFGSGNDIFANGEINKFFVKHSDQILESLLQTDEGQATLQTYFRDTLFSVDTPQDIRTQIEDAISNYVGDQVANSGTNAPIIGDKVGELFGTIQAAGREALASASDAEKDRITEFTVGVLSKALGALIGKGITALGTSVGGPAGTGVGIAANAIIGQILSNVFKVSDPNPEELAQKFIEDLTAAGGDINLGENLLEELNDKFNQVIAQLNAEIEKTDDPELKAELNEARTRLEQLLRSMNDSYQIRLND